MFVHKFYLFSSGFLSSSKMLHTYHCVILGVRHSEAIMFICSFADIHFGHLVKVSFIGGSEGKASAYNVGDLEMATHSSILTRKIPWTEKPGRLQSMGLKELGTTEHLHFHFQGIFNFSIVWLWFLLVSGWFFFLDFCLIVVKNWNLNDGPVQLKLLLLSHFSHVRLCATP